MGKFDWLNIKDDSGNKIEGPVAVESNEFHTFPAGDRVTFKILEVEPRKSGSGNDMVNVKFELLGTNGEKGITYESFVWLKKALWKHVELFKATGQLTGDEEISDSDLKRLYEEAENEGKTGKCIMGEPEENKWNSIDEFEKKRKIEV